MNAQVWALLTAIAGTLGIRQFITWLLNRGKVGRDEATVLRQELRSEIQRKDVKIEALESRISRIEEENEIREQDFGKREDAFNREVLRFRLYKVDVYRVLAENGVAADVIVSINRLDEGNAR